MIEVHFITELNLRIQWKNKIYFLRHYAFGMFQWHSYIFDWIETTFLAFFFYLIIQKQKQNHKTLRWRRCHWSSTIDLSTFLLFGSQWFLATVGIGITIRIVVTGAGRWWTWIAWTIRCHSGTFFQIHLNRNFS